MSERVSEREREEERTLIGERGHARGIERKREGGQREREKERGSERERQIQACQTTPTACRQS